MVPLLQNLCGNIRNWSSSRGDKWDFIGVQQGKLQRKNLPDPSSTEMEKKLFFISQKPLPDYSGKGKKIPQKIIAGLRGKVKKKSINKIQSSGVNEGPGRGLMT